MTQRKAGASPTAVRAAIACAVCMSIGLAPLFIGTFPVFLVPVSKEFGWGLSIFPRALLTAALTSALVGPVAGRLIDRYGVRPFMLAGIGAWGVSILALSFMPGNGLMIYLTPALIGIVSAFSGPISFAKVVSGWFDRNRGIVLGLVVSAAPAAATAGAVIAARELILTVGWRGAYRALAGIILVVGWPTALLYMREAPAIVRAASGGPADTAALVTGMRTAQALRTLDFWLLIGATCLTCGAINGVIGHFMAWSNERGLSASLAAAAVSMFSLIGPAGPILAGTVVDRMRGPRALFLFYALPLIGLTVVTFAGPMFQIPGMVLLGLGFSAVSGLLPYLSTRYFGLRCASEIFGIVIGVVTLAMGAGPVFIGFGRDLTNGYRQPIAVAFISLILALFISTTFRRYRYGGHSDPGIVLDAPPTSDATRTD